MIKVLLIDLDSKIPNIALMKISTYHKSMGDSVELIKLNLDYYPAKNKKKYVDASDYDKVYCSIIFQTNKDNIIIKGCDDIEYGGTGCDISKKLPDDIEIQQLDYSIYPDNKEILGFITRGCIRNCPFCFVPKKEGGLYKYSNWREIYTNGIRFGLNKVRFMDNNFLAYKNSEEVMQELIDAKIRVSFNEGLDIRLMTDSKARLLSMLNYYPTEYIFAFDNINLKPLIEEKFAILKKYIVKDWKIKFFIYCNAEMDLKDTIDRILWCKDNKVLPYIMRDINCFGSENKNFYTDICAYCNQPSFFKKLSFEDFMMKRTKNKERIERSTNLFSKMEDVNVVYKWRYF